MRDALEKKTCEGTAMIQINDLNAIQDQEIFLRRDEVRDVSAPVADIIRTVREQGTAPCTSMPAASTGRELSGLSVTGAELEAALEQVGAGVPGRPAGGGGQHPGLPRQTEAGELCDDPAGRGHPGTEDPAPWPGWGIYVPGGTAAYPPPF